MLLMEKNPKFFLSLVRLGVGNDSLVEFSQLDWSEIKMIAERQGLSAVVLDGIEELKRRKLVDKCELPPKPLLLEWVGEVLQGYEYRYKLYRRAIAELASFYKRHGYKMMVLKGFACSIDWPKPEHRPAGDIDIWLFGQQKEADEILKKETGIKIDNDRQHHTIFDWRNFMVENHYDFLDVHHHKSNIELEKLFKEMGKDDSHFVELYGEKVYVPSTNMHALFLLKHAMSHFAAEGITLRNLMDWGFFVKAHTKEIDWKWLEGILEEYGMMPAYNIFNAICVGDFGFEPSLFPKIQFNPFMKDKVLKEILCPAFSRMMPESFFSRVIYKIRRWRGNEWKHELCYSDSLWSAFWSGVWNHLKKPGTI